MDSVKQKYVERQLEIVSIINFLDVLQYREENRIDNDTEFGQFVNLQVEDLYDDYPNIEKSKLSYANISNILKSNLGLMFYNLIESTVSDCLQAIYTAIEDNHVSFEKASDKIRSIWQTSKWSHARNPSSNLSTYQDISCKLIDHILNEKTVELSLNDTMPSGNLDSIKILKLFKNHGIDMDSEHLMRHQNILKNVRDNRNVLSHGERGFSETYENWTIKDFKNNYEIIVQTLDKIIESTNHYLDSESYLHP